ncbi:hypothetical protein FOFC_13721 [Fusarium oxysporum]|nr:hypothetical protein FOFC_13721 [Fusarium oxysporum]
MRECFFYTSLQRAFLLTPQYATSISSRTVLFTSVPKEYLNKRQMDNLFNHSVKNIWIPGDTKELDRIIQERDNVAMKLEKGEIKWIKLCNKERIKYENKTDVNVEKVATARSDSESGNLVAGWIPHHKRPTHRTGLLGLIGKKVDTIQWGRQQLKALIPKVQSAQSSWLAGKYKKHCAIFVEFFTLYDAHLAFHAATHHRALQMADRFIGIRPNEVIWQNLNYSRWQVAIRRYAAYATITGLIVFWAVPVTIIGLIAQVDVIKTLPGLTWIENIPQVILGTVSGLLPSIALSFLMSLAPLFIRICARRSGCVSLSQAELFTQKAYFMFQVLQVFLVQTLSNSFISSLVKVIRNPSNIFSILSSSIPTASNFYISFFIVQGLTIATSVLTQIIGFIIFAFSFRFANDTPRSRYYKWIKLSALSWGSLMPIYTNMAVISIVYAVIAPFLLLWSTIGMVLFYIAYRYNVLYVAETEIDTRGLLYPQALKQLLTGVYLAEVCLVGMFIVSKAAGPAFLMAIFLALTIICHISLAKVLDPLLQSTPLSLQLQEDPVDQRHQMKEMDGQAQKGVGATSRGPSNSNLGSKFVSKANDGDWKTARFFSKLLKPCIYADHTIVENLVHHEDREELEYPYDAHIHAYLPPSVTSQTPFLWIPSDGDAGMSRQEIFDTEKVTPISNKGCKLNNRNQIEWDTDEPRPPDWCEKIIY